MILRVVTLDDGETVHNAFFDRGFIDNASATLDLSTLDAVALPVIPPKAA